MSLDDKNECLMRQNKSNVTLIFQLATRIKDDLNLLQELIQDVGSTVKVIYDECGTLIDMTGRKLVRDAVLDRCCHMPIQRQNAVTDDVEVD